ncbi:MAG: FAD-dependent oxidoreductase [Polyangiaceae bacterium]
MKTAVIGGGLSGLVAALRLVERGHAVTLFEASERLGGQIHTLETDGLVIEIGAEGFIARSETVPALARDLGVEDALLDQATTLTFADEPGGLRALGPGEAAALLGFQVPKEELGRGIRSFRRGMGQLVDALVRRLEPAAVLRRGVRVRGVERRAEALAMTLEDGTACVVDAAVVATPAGRAAALLAPLGLSVAAPLASGRMLSNASVILRYARDQIAHPLDGSGLVVPTDAQRDGFRACSFVTTKFERGTPPDVVLLRAFFRPTEAELAARDDRAWIALATSAIARPLGVRGEPIAAWTSVWPAALPVYDAAYKEAVARADEALAPLSIALAGSHVHGAGIDAAVQSAERAAASLHARAR